MEPQDLKTSNLGLAVAGILTELRGINKRLDQQDVLLVQIREQTIKTNGRLIGAEAAIVDGTQKCNVLSDKVRSLEDSRLQATSAASGARWVIAAAGAVGAAVAAVLDWFLKK